MDPKEWQRLADEVAAEVGGALDQIESEFWPDSVDPSFRSFWPRIRTLSERLRTAPAIDIEVKLSLLGRIRQITKRARQDQEEFFTEKRHAKAEIVDRIEELKTEALASADPVEVRRLREELSTLREPVAGLDAPTRADRQEVWEAWKTGRQAVWDHLNALWGGNQSRLEEPLGQARQRLDRGNVKETRELIRHFNSLSRELEVSHKTARELRSRANKLWQEANEVAQAKHEEFLNQAPQKVERWKEVRGRNARAIGRIRAEIAELERNATAGDVAAALTKAMIEERMRELERLESTNDSLEDRIENTESALTPVG